MARQTVRPSQAAGLPPGTLFHVGRPREEAVRVTVIDYDAERLEERDVTAAEAHTYRDKASVTWINVDGVHDLDVVKEIGERFCIHPLATEDIVATVLRPKAEEYENQVFIVLKMLYVGDEAGSVESEQVSLVLGDNFVITFQERRGDVFDAVRERIRNDKGRIRKSGADYLAYALIDAIVDNYFVVLENLGERIEFLENEVVSEPSKETLRRVYSHKREIIRFRRSIWPLREVISSLERGESELFEKATLIYLRDVYDHTIQVIDTVEAFRDTVSGLVEVYLSSVSNRMNDVMKVLTIIATIFIPLTFIAGIYGMNFQPPGDGVNLNMPELQWRYGYIAALTAMAVVAGLMVLYFKRKRWL
jgi:magnesium transporter